MVLVGCRKPESYLVAFLCFSPQLFPIVLLEWDNCSLLFAVDSVHPCWDHYRWRRMAFIKESQSNSHEGRRGVISWDQMVCTPFICSSPAGCSAGHLENALFLLRSSLKAVTTDTVKTACHTSIIACVSCQLILWVTSELLWLECRVSSKCAQGYWVISLLWLHIGSPSGLSCQTQGQVPAEDTMEYCRKAEYLRYSHKWAKHCDRQSGKR